MANKMLIDASHPEETRVVVTRGNKVEEFDYESANRKPLRGNIYLAKVTRVEPSLQAAFVDYGGNRHGFLAFSEIHPDYYQVPVADRTTLLNEDGVEIDVLEVASDQDENIEKGEQADLPEDYPEAGELSDSENPTFDTVSNGEADRFLAETEALSEDISAEETGTRLASTGFNETVSIADVAGDGEAAAKETDTDAIEQIGGGDEFDDVPERNHLIRRGYKIQEVIKRRQILLVQVVKEERGNKGAALTTYLSLAGRYSVLMPNTARGGGVSRKITNVVDRKRLKEAAQELDVPEGMGIILRTAGATRTKPEIRRDFDYLMRVWETIRELTLQSSAPALVHEEGSLIKRTIRDLYNKDIDDIIVSGEGAYREAKGFMRALMPSHAKLIKLYREPHPLFAEMGIESQLDAMFSNRVTLRSGGTIVINPTEALVSIDVNSGRSTREHNIEDTALRTNLEAAEEVARQLRLRDLAGLIVIDFIDMEENRNNRAVEKKLKDCLKDDRARIQVGRISPFGLMEMSRQRIRTGVLESSTVVCPHCNGAGFVRATSSIALLVLRAVEEMLLKGAPSDLKIRTHSDAAFYMLNQKRTHLRELEDRFGVSLTVMADTHLAPDSYYLLERGETATRIETKSLLSGLSLPPLEDDFDEVEEEAETSGVETEAPVDGSVDIQVEDGEATDEAVKGKRRRRRRRGAGWRTDEASGSSAVVQDNASQDTASQDTASLADVEKAEDETSELDAANSTSSSEDAQEKARRRRRGRRGGRRGERAEHPTDHVQSSDPSALVAHGETTADDAVSDSNTPEIEQGAMPLEAEDVVVDETASPRARRPARRAPRRKQPLEEAETGGSPNAVEAEPVPRSPEAETPVVTHSVVTPPEPAMESHPEPEEPVTIILTPPEEDSTRPKRSGWWAKAKATFVG